MVCISRVRCAVIVAALASAVHVPRTWAARPTTTSAPVDDVTEPVSAVTESVPCNNSYCTVSPAGVYAYRSKGRRWERKLNSPTLVAKPITSTERQTTTTSTTIATTTTTTVTTASTTTTSSTTNITTTTTTTRERDGVYTFGKCTITKLKCCHTTFLRTMRDYATQLRQW